MSRSWKRQEIPLWSRCGRRMAEDAGIIYYLDSDMPEQDFSGLTGEESYYLIKRGKSLSFLMNIRWRPDIWEQSRLQFRRRRLDISRSQSSKI